MAQKKSKKKQPHIDKSPVRKKKAKGWVKTYTGTDIIKDYREHFKGVDVACAVRELQEIGYKFDPDYEKNVMKAEAARINQLHKKKAQKQKAETYENEYQDDNFYFIAGYTSGGAPYGVTWTEMGLEPWENEFDDDDEDSEESGFICPFCKGDITKVIGCTLSVFIHEGKEYERFKVGGIGDFFEGADDDATCDDCGSLYGHYHHYGCDCEYCPVCGGQLITCGCEVQYKK
ncbi:MAG: hypothetical protein FWD71_16935 [Oscillospiraceae bacterium]|nr:hypothetical protein [Oscillospiraceae bacterium]